MDGELPMKFVTVMDMWLLLCNLGLLGMLAYYGKRLLKLVARATRDSEDLAARHERDWFVSTLQQEIDNLTHLGEMSNAGSEFLDQINAYKDLIAKINERSNRRGRR